MSKKPQRKRPAPAHAGRSKPISFRLEQSLIAQIDNVAAHLGATRSRVVSSVLNEYVQERGDKEIERIIRKEASLEKPLDIFA